MSTTLLKFGNKVVGAMSLPPSLCLWYWLWAGIYLLKYRFLYVKSLVFHASINFQVKILIRVQYTFLSVILEKILSLIAVLVHYIRKRFSESSQNFWSRQDKIIEIQFLLKVHLYRFISSPVLYTNSKYVSHVWTVIHVPVRRI